ncbi:MAG: SprB repeat-containing protein, partial [Saprospiraceae bacterium]|nr:SprB repeat-containing protein [Saprospiraceae bacterium]
MKRLIYTPKRFFYFLTILFSLYQYQSSTAQSLILNITDASCNPGGDGAISTVATGGTGPYTYIWSNGATTPDITNLSVGAYSVTVTDALGSTGTAFAIVNIANPVAAIIDSIQSINCSYSNDGAIFISAAGGTPPYSFLWSDGSTAEDLVGVGAGAYMVTITDANGCTATEGPIEFFAPTPIDITVDLITNVTCNGGSDGAISTTVIEGTAPYSFLWSNGATTEDITNIPAGSYDITVTDANGCTATSTGILVTEPAPITPTITGQINVFCNGGSNGSLDMEVSNGIPPYTYAWSNGAITQDISGLSAGNYSVTITDDIGCTVVGDFSITQPDPLGINLDALVNISCNGLVDGAIDISGTGGTAPYTYAWSNGATTEDISSLGIGTYTVTITDANSCTFVDNYTITEPDVLALTLNASTNVSCNGGNDGAIDINPTGGTLPYTYNWSNGATTEDISGLSVGTYTVTLTDANSCTFIDNYTITEPLTLSILLANAVDPLCNTVNNGSIDVTVSNGTAPYTYNWSNGATTEDISGLSAGTYTITATDANTCTTTFSVTLSESFNLSINLDALVNVSCNAANDGTIDISIPNGTAPYTYLWSNGATTEDVSGLSPNTYTITVSDNNTCSATNTFNITEPSPLVVTLDNQVDILCNAAETGELDISVSGGTAPYTYNWSNGQSTQDLSSIPAGTYIVTVTDANNCTLTDTYTLTEPPALNLSSNTITNVSCNGLADGSIDIDISGGIAPYIFSWSTGATTEDISTLPAGTYTLTVTDNNACTITDTYTITEPDVLEINLNLLNNITCNGNNDGSIDIAVIGGTAPYSFVWSNGETTEDITGLAPANYTVTVTDANGCTDVDIYTITQPDILEINLDLLNNITCNGDNDGSIDLTISGGTAPYSYLWSNGETTEDLAGLAPGTYTLTITDANACIDTETFIIDEPDVLEVNLGNLVSLDCNNISNGAIDIDVTGGTAPYTFVWSNGATTEDLVNLFIGNFTVTVTDNNGCVASATYVINGPTPIDITLVDLTNITCNGDNDGSIDLDVSGGILPYVYTWSNGATTQDIANLSPGSYTVTVTDANACEEIRTYVIAEPDILSINLDILSDISCNGLVDGFIDINITGGTTPYSVNWSNGATTQDISNLTQGNYTITVVDANGCTDVETYTIVEPPVLVLSLDALSNLTCNNSNDGTIDISVVGGTPSYSYLWSNGATSQNVNNLSAGTFSVTVTDDRGCTDADTFTLIQPPAIIVTLDNITNITCNGDNDGSIEISVTGGFAPYTYLWSNGATTDDISNLGPGNYTVTVTDATGCEQLETYAILEPPVLEIELDNLRNVVCNGQNNGFINTTINGGTAPFTINWSNGATTDDIANLSPGSYTITVVDANGCIDIETYIINEPDPLVVTDSATSTINCYGQAGAGVNINVTGGTAPYFYDWSNDSTTQNVSGITSGFYTVIVTDLNGCQDSVSFFISEPDSLQIQLDTLTNETCFDTDDGTIDVSILGGTAPYVYTWSNGATTQDVSGLAQGNYTLIVTDSNGCTDSRIFTIIQPSDLRIDLDTLINISCNGANDGSIDINVFGSVPPYTYTWSNGATTQDISGLTPGTYSVTVVDANGCTELDTFVITQPDSLEIALVGLTNLTCNLSNDGTIDINVTGGTIPYFFNWSNGATSEDLNNLAEGSYSVTVTDINGCQDSATYTLTAPTPILTTLDSLSNITCNGDDDGAISISVSGSVPPYTYLWSNGATTQDITGLSPGNYNITVTDASGCQDIQTYIITEPDVLDINLDLQTNISCNSAGDGSLDISIAGGTAPYVINWSNGATTQDIAGLTPGTYIV